MGDLKEIALTQKNDCKWVRALDENGNSIRISKEDLAAVVGELLGVIPYKGKLAINSDINKIGSIGIYDLNGTYLNAPFTQSWGWLIVIGSISRTQIICDASNTTFALYARRNNTESWKKIVLNSL